jgi:hypothetical protein
MNKPNPTAGRTDAEAAIVQAKLEAICREHGIIIVGDVYTAEDYLARTAEADAASATEDAIRRMRDGAEAENYDCPGCNECAPTDTQVDEMAGLPTISPEIEEEMQTVLDAINAMNLDGVHYSTVSELLSDIFGEPDEGFSDDGITPDEVIDGFEALRAGIQQDEGFAWSWHCNLALEIYEGGVPHSTANKIAAKLMKKIFDVDTMGIFN